MAAVLIASMASPGLAGDYVYFGEMRQTLSASQGLFVLPVAGLIGGVAGGCFSRLMLSAGRTPFRPVARLRSRRFCSPGYAA
ncbi:hypothetical protein ACFOKF_23225 [Sphingobium rhizovicinum]|uniref:Uncharacterized protein n=1 Tax=Sphingobium rhizovicinum TaxID=432308 RepID=A0ABV7NNR4_9SPHN